VTSRVRRRDNTAQVVIRRDKPNDKPNDKPTDKPICVLDFPLPPVDGLNEGNTVEAGELGNGVEQVISSLRTSGRHSAVLVSKADLRLTDIAELIHEDWVRLAAELGFSVEHVGRIHTEFTYPSEQALVMLQDWSSTTGSVLAANELQCALERIGRDDIIANCITHIETVTGDTDRNAALQFLQQDISAELVPDDGESVKLKVDYQLETCREESIDNEIRVADSVPADNECSVADSGPADNECSVADSGPADNECSVADSGPAVENVKRANIELTQRQRVPADGLLQEDSVDTDHTQQQQQQQPTDAEARRDDDLEIQQVLCAASASAEMIVGDEEQDDGVDEDETFEPLHYEHTDSIEQMSVLS